MRRAQLNRYVLPEFGHKCLDELNAVEFENWLVSLPLSNSTKNHLRYTLGIILREAKREGFIKSNPLDDVEPMGQDFEKRDTLTAEELDKLFPVDPKENETFRLPAWRITPHQIGMQTDLAVDLGFLPNFTLEIREKIGDPHAIEEEFFFRAISGDLDIDAEWDACVERWLREGGKILTDEANRQWMAEK